LPVVLVLCLIGANLYWIGVVVRFRSLFGAGSRALALDVRS
jgi:hypothetical protein